MWLRACILALALFAYTAHAHACGAFSPADLADIQRAETVIVGRISNYQASGDAAIFDVAVDEVLWGEAPKNLTVSWYNPSMALPESMSSETRVIPLLAGKSRFKYVVLQEFCSGALIFPNDSEEAHKIRWMLSTQLFPPSPLYLPEIQ